ncbi:hypothetical protein PHAVU_005G056000 [Phaseolus vulgaris]
MEAQENDSLVVETEPSTSHAPGADDSLRQSSDVLARGLSSMLSAVITDFDCRAHQTLRSQDHLSSVLDRLTGGDSDFSITITDLQSRLLWMWSWRLS